MSSYVLMFWRHFFRFGLVWFGLGLVWFGLGLVLILDSLLRELDLRKTKLYLKLGAYQ